ncbi:MAG: pyruvate, phosphate dikinase/phosphoenolpyruvate synthase regulator [Acidithiobacillus sp.]|uniref:pyruvate, phosphate dikinase/phosphoenolpyruvate synthase regulator n=2 Tax=Acidithiobacillus sp. TaxID=1872118 RepID=UPI003CFDB363
MEAAKDQRQVFFVSDRTGLTASSYGKSLLAQFRDIAFSTRTIPFVDGLERAEAAAREIDACQRRTGQRAIVFSTLVDAAAQRRIVGTGAFVLNLFEAFITPLEKELARPSVHTLGRAFRPQGEVFHQRWLDAMEFALAHDDGIHPEHYSEADLILVGVSRSGKTPTALFLAMNFSLKVGNYPLTDGDLEHDALPAPLAPWRNKLVALTIEPETLHTIREKRRASPQYAALSVCRREVRAAERIFRKAHLPVFDSTGTSVEELASGILKCYQELAVLRPRG